MNVGNCGRPDGRKTLFSRPGRTLSDSDNRLLDQDLEQTNEDSDADSRAFREKLAQLREVFPQLSAEQLIQILDIATSLEAEDYSSDY